ncbi:MAG: ATPase [Bacteroidetes bacterium]|nr:MAG: ATPase [Bacteroidota bacterium]
MQIAIASGKGGTGKTTLSVNLATLLSRQVERAFKVLLVDMDVEEPNSGLFLKGKLLRSEVKYRLVADWDEKKCTFCKRCANICEFNAIAYLGISVMVFPELCHSCYACSDLCPEDALPMIPHRMGEMKEFKLNDRLYFLESRLDIGVEQATPLIEQSRKEIRKMVDDHWITIIDAPPGTSCPVMEAVKDADIVLLVTEPTPFGLHDLTLAVETMRELKKPIAVVINKYGIGNNEVEKYCQKNRIPVIGKIPNLKEAAMLYSKGETLIDAIPEIKVEIENIYQGIIKLMEEKK